jgi:hypothetical protein
MGVVPVDARGHLILGEKVNAHRGQVLAPIPAQSV